MNKIKCSVGILTFNSGKTLKRALESVKDFDDIIICDGGSTDRTLDIAKQYSCKIIQQDKKFKSQNGALIDYAGVRNQTLDVSTYDWFLFIDSDEYLSQEAVNEIKNITEKDSSSPAAYWVPRKYVISDEMVECASTYPNKQIRFFNKNVAVKFVKKIHEKIKLKEGAKVLTLQNVMLVPLEEDVVALRNKWDRYIQLEVERRGDITIGKCGSAGIEAIKVFVLYSFRLLRNMVLCRGKKLPFVYEKEYQIYSFRLFAAIFKKMLKK